MRRLALVAAAFVLCTACKLSLVIGVDARSDGSGVVRATVTLDKEAAARLQRAGSGLAADDLRKAGWKVTGPEKLGDGGARLVATKPFNTPGELGGVIDEVAGPRRPLHDFALVRRRSFFRTKIQFRGVVDLTAGISAFGDDRLKQQTGADAGLDPSELERQANTTLNHFFSIQVAVRFPGKVTSNAPTGNGAAWRPKLGEQAALVAQGSALDVRRILLLSVAIVAVAALILVLLQRVRTMRTHDEGSYPIPLR